MCFLPDLRLLPVLCAMADHIFRLKDTPLGTLLVKFYQVEPYSDEAFTRAQALDFLQATAGSGNSWSLSLSGNHCRQPSTTRGHCPATRTMPCLYRCAH